MYVCYVWLHNLFYKDNLKITKSRDEMDGKGEERCLVQFVRFYCNLCFFFTFGLRLSGLLDNLSLDYRNFTMKFIYS